MVMIWLRGAFTKEFAIVGVGGPTQNRARLSYLWRGVVLVLNRLLAIHDNHCFVGGRLVEGGYARVFFYDATSAHPAFARGGTSSPLPNVCTQCVAYHGARRRDTRCGSQ